MSEQSSGGIERSEDHHSAVYEHRGPGASSDIVARVKQHHAEENDARFRDLVARKIGSGGSHPKITTVVVVEVLRP